MQDFIHVMCYTENRAASYGQKNVTFYKDDGYCDEWKIKTNKYTI